MAREKAQIKASGEKVQVDRQLSNVLKDFKLGDNLLREDIRFDFPNPA